MPVLERRVAARERQDAEGGDESDESGERQRHDGAGSRAKLAECERKADDLDDLGAERQGVHTVRIGVEERKADRRSGDVGENEGAEHERRRPGGRPARRAKRERNANRDEDERSGREDRAGPKPLLRVGGHESAVNAGAHGADADEEIAAVVEQRA